MSLLDTISWFSFFTLRSSSLMMDRLQIAMVFLKEYLNTGAWSGICETGLETIPLENEAWRMVAALCLTQTLNINPTWVSIKLVDQHGVIASHLLVCCLLSCRMQCASSYAWVSGQARVKIGNRFTELMFFKKFLGGVIN